jgi:hypothetical protein
MQPRNAAPAIFVSLLLAAGCDPTPHFPPVVPPPPGLIQYEAEMVARDDIPTTFYVDQGLWLSIPAGAVPNGTPVTVRLLVGVGSSSGPRMAERPLVTWVSAFGDSAIQVLPESLVLSSPGEMRFSRFPAPSDRVGTCPVVLHARSEDSEWQVVGRATITGSDSTDVVDLSVSIDRGGLWSVAWIIDGCTSVDGGVDAQRG